MGNSAIDQNFWGPAGLLGIALCFAAYVLWAFRSGYIFMNRKRGPIYRAQDPGPYWLGIGFLVYLVFGFVALALWEFGRLQP
jgi:hypothetical protein